MNHLPNIRRKVHPKDKANILSQIFFIHILPVFRNGFRRELQEDDLYEVPESFRSSKLGDAIEKAWKTQKCVGQSSIFRVLWSTYGKTYFLMGFTQLAVTSVVIILQPYALSKFITYFLVDQQELTMHHAVSYAAIVVILNIAEGVFNNNYHLMLTGIGIKARTAISSLIYRKSLRVNSNWGATSVGKIVTLITKDVQSLETFVTCANALWIGSIITIVAVYVLYNALGTAAFVGVSVLVIAMPLQVLMGRWGSKLRKNICKKTDVRLQRTKEALSTIKILKMYSWEKYFTTKINAARRSEVQLTFQMCALKLLVLVTASISRYISFYLMFFASIWLGNPMTAETFYFMLRCYQHIAYNLSDLFASGVTQMAEFYASMKRIEEVLNYKEINMIKPVNPLSLKVTLKNVTIYIKDKKILSNVSLTITDGLTILTGPIGSGKSTILKCLAHEYEPDEGNLEVGGRISYASQEPWMFPSSIKQNILFGEPFDETRYQEVVDVCALRYDFDVLPEGDDTIVEDHGMNLSKGQQARINLARAVYRNSDIYLLDDPLAALDHRVGDFIFAECILKFLKSKLVILVEHNHLEEANNIVVVENGRIKSVKTLLELNQTETYQSCKRKTEPHLADLVEDEEENVESTTLLRRPLRRKSVHQDINKTGQVKYSVYWKYFKLGGGFLAFLGVVLVFVAAQVSDSLIDKLWSKWTDLGVTPANDSIQNSTSQLEKYGERRNYLLKLHLICISMLILLIAGRAAVLFIFSKNVSLNLHKQMITAVTYAKMQFFDINFIGNILNRFSKDLTTIDEIIPFVLFDLLIAFILLICIVIVIATVNVTFLIPTFFFFIILLSLRIYYLPTGRNLKRLDASTRSPLVGHLNATLEGLTTVRAFQIENILTEEFDRHQDLYTSANYTLQSGLSTFIFWLDNICSLFIAIIMSRFLIFSKVAGNLSGEVGLAVTQSFMMTEKLRTGIRQWADVENQMTSVERTLEYSQMKTEKSNGVVAENWPQHGKISYEGVSIAFGSRENALKNINFTIDAQEKIGIIGRTGAGKSTLIAALFRLYDVKKGRIIIDGIDIKMMSLEVLRSHISIIPQDPVLFTGTIRDNIDPEGKYSDQEIWQAIEAAHLSSIIKNLHLEIEDCGSYFSAGQKQLICIARAVIRRNKIVVMDEATANMDPKTEELVRETMQKHFNSCTMLIIAHRLRSLLDCDKIMVLEKGEIKEFGQPAQLMNIKNGMFFNMVKASRLIID